MGKYESTRTKEVEAEEAEEEANEVEEEWRSGGVEDRAKDAQTAQNPENMGDKENWL